MTKLCFKSRIFHLQIVKRNRQEKKELENVSNLVKGNSKFDGSLGWEIEFVDSLSV